MKLADRTKADGAALALSLGVTAVVLSLASPARAIQPLSAFIQASNDANTDLQITRSTNEQRDAEADRSSNALLPSFTAQGTYTRNQYEVAFPASLFGGTGTIVILPQNQWDASLTLSVPIIDVAGWERRKAAHASE